MNWFDETVVIIGRIVWGPHMLVLLIGTGIYFTVVLKGIQFRKFREAARSVFQPRGKGGANNNIMGDVSPFQALSVSLGAVVGNGNIVGVATAIAIGGRGAIFWMWISGLVGMATRYGEVILGMQFRKSNPDGTVIGGPMWYLRESIPWKNAGKLLAGFSALSMGVRGLLTASMVQSNSIAHALETSLGITNWVTGLVLAVLVGIVIIGGIKVIARACAILSPVMSVIYIVAGIAIIALFWRGIPAVMYGIVQDAFSGTAAAGGFAGSSMMIALRFGVARGAYSNEAGNGSAAVVHAAAKTRHPVQQALIAMLDVFIDTIVLCSITGLAILLTGEWLAGTTGAELATDTFAKQIPFGGWVVVLSSLLFGYSSMITWPYIGEQASAYLVGFWIKPYFRWAFCIAVVVGSIIKVNTVWLIGDILNGISVIPNLIGMVAMTGIIITISKSYVNKSSEQFSD